MRKLLAYATVALLAACAGSPAGQARSAAQSTTQAVYNDDPAGVASRFDSQLKGQVTRSEVGILSDQMHRFGSYNGLTFVSSDPAKNEYTYRANFSNGSMNVVLRLDQNGTIGAYRVFVPRTALR